MFLPINLPSLLTMQPLMAALMCIQETQDLCHVLFQCGLKQGGLHPAAGTLVPSANAGIWIIQDICKGVVKEASTFKVCILPECSWAAASSLVSPSPAPLSHFLPSTSEPAICHSKWLLIPHKLISSLHGHAPEGLETFSPSLHSKLGLKTGLLDPTP